MKRTAIVAAIVSAPLLVIFLLLKGVVVVDCWLSWSDSTMEYRTRLLSCQVKHPTLGWIPEKRVRGTE